MAPLSLFLTAGILAISGVEAANDKVRLFQYASTTCDGHPIGKQFELERGKCRPINAAALRATHPDKEKDAKWIDAVNKGKLECYVTTYDQPGCPDGALDSWKADQKLAHVAVPYGFGACKVPYEEKPHPSYETHREFRSVKFHCEAPGYAGIVVNTTQTLPIASVSLDHHKTPVLTSTFTTTITRPIYTYPTGPNPNPPHFLPPRSSLEPRAQEYNIQPRVHRENIKGVWMKHPWGGGIECFECWTEYIGGEFNCEAGPDTNVNCGPFPTADTSNSLYWTSTHAYASTTTEHEVNPATTTIRIAPTAGVQERSEKKMINIRHPYIPGYYVCAKSKWHHAGKHNQRVDIEGPKKCNEEADEWPEHISYTSTTSTHTETFTHTISRVHTVWETIRTPMIKIPVNPVNMMGVTDHYLTFPVEALYETIQPTPTVRHIPAPVETLHHTVYITSTLLE